MHMYMHMYMCMYMYAKHARACTAAAPKREMGRGAAASREYAVCDPCRHAPDGASLSSCVQRTDDGCPIARCAWVERLPRTFGVQFGPGARGWGNSFSYVRNLHEVAALLGRRLLLHPVGSYLPADHLLLGNGTWAVMGDAFKEHLSRAHIVTEKQAAAATGSGKFVRGSNQSAYRNQLLRYLGGFADRQHLWFNVTRTGKGAHYILSKSGHCPDVPHGADFLRCMGRLMTTPSPELQAQLEAVRRPLWRDPAHRGYAAVHIRTFGADMGVPRRATPNPLSLLQFLAWEVQVNASTYAAAAKRLCERVARNNMSLWVASDSRGAVGIFEHLCPGQVAHLGRSYTRVHLESRALYKNRSQASAGLIDWLVLSGADWVVKFGALHSSFSTSAALNGCRPRQKRSPKDWRYASAGLWLIGKIRGASHRHRRDPNASYDCASPLASMLNSTPCATPCLRQCIATLEEAYA